MTATIGSAFTKHTVAAAGFDVTTYSAGPTEADPVLYLPGGGGPSMSRALDTIAEQFRVHMIELPGWGSQPNDVANFDGLASQVAEIATALGLDRFHLMGTSLGGACALHLALLHPERVISMVLECPAKFRKESRNPGELAPEEFVKAFRTHPERLPHFQPPDHEFMGRVWPTVERLMGDPDTDPAFLARMESCPVRTLVLFGTNDGVINPINAPTYRRHLKNSTLQYVYDAAHAIQEDRPEAFAETVTDFLARGMVFFVNQTSSLINP